MITSFFALGLFVLLFTCVLGECPNACSGRGVCKRFDVCECYKGWIDNDCSSRSCPFGRAHADTPVGDLDATGKNYSVVNPILYSQLYPGGINADYPVTIGPNFTIQQNTGHEYVECSNKGICDRNSGTCSCMDGFTGTACQRNECGTLGGKVCKGKGTCESARTFAWNDNQNLYQLWDADINMGCLCDPGYTGAVCEDRTCKIGWDPMFFDTKTSRMSQSSRRFSNWTIVIAAPKGNQIVGNYSLVFYDYSGREWITGPIDIAATCNDIVNKLEGLPFTTIPYNSTLCVEWPSFSSNVSDAPSPSLRRANALGFAADPHQVYEGRKYILSFPMNPGTLRQMNTKLYFDSKQPSLFSVHPSTPTIPETTPVQRLIYPDGFYGEMNEVFMESCPQVDVTIQNGGDFNYLGGLTGLEGRLLAQCLGKANAQTGTYSAQGRVQGNDYVWDYGDIYNPHLVRFVQAAQFPPTDLCPGRMNSTKDGHVRCSSPYPYAPGFLVPLYFDPVLSLFVIMNYPASDFAMDTTFHVFTTSGVAQMVSEDVQVYTLPTTPYSRVIYTSNSTSRYPHFQGAVDCATTTANVNGAHDCVEKGKTVFVLNPYNFLVNPLYLNLYTVSKIHTLTPFNTHEVITNPSRILLDKSINGAWPWSGVTNSSATRLYVFTPPLPSQTFPYVAVCGNRGLCDSSSGVCTCFSGYGGDDCSSIDNSLTNNFQSLNEI